MSLRSVIVDTQKEAMKSKDTETLAVIRLIFATIRNTEIDKGRELNDEEVLAIIRSQNKQLQDALKDFESAARQDLIEKTKSEIEIVKRFLPPELGDEDIQNVIEKIRSQNPVVTVGQLMGMVMKELSGRADGNRVRAMIESTQKPS